MIIKVKNVEAEKVEEFSKLMKDEAFAASVAELETVEAVKAAFAAKGAEFTDEEVEAFAKAINEALNSEEELSETDLDDVAGGGGTFTLVDIEWQTKKGTKITLHIPW